MGQEARERVTDAPAPDTGPQAVETLRQMAARLGVPFLEGLDGCEVPSVYIEAIPVAFSRRYAVVAVGQQNGVLSVATASGLDWRPLDDIARALDRGVCPVVAPRQQILRLVDAAYGAAARAEQAISEDMEDLADLVAASEQRTAAEDLVDLSRKPPIIRLVNRILLQAMELSASDVHLQPAVDELLVRFRVDGLLHDVMALPKRIERAVVSRVKVMGRMDVADRLLAQDGRATVAIGRREVDLRIASIPTAHGEEVVLRLLDRAAGLLTLDELGMESATAGEFRGLLAASHGMILVTGPTGSGKTTTLYAAIGEFDARSQHVLTIEEPIEYQLPGVSQTQVNRKKGLTFASGLRHMLRQDPDIIMVGEIRDLETARMAVQSALTGHLVLSTLHTNDAVTAVTRLVDLGIEPYLVCSSVLGVLAQRLVRCICSRCRHEVEAAASVVDGAGTPDPERPMWAGAGCTACLQTGYHGRTGVFELLRLDERLREGIMRGERPSILRAIPLDQGFRTMRADGMTKASRGVTTVEEVLRVAQDDGV